MSEPSSVLLPRESAVASYNRAFPAVFHRAVGSHLITAEGTHYLDFFSGAGANNYGHNPPALKQALLEYLAEDGVVNSLDLTTVAKQRFVDTFTGVVLEPRGLDHRLMFTGPTGTNAVEAALKLVRKVTGRPTVAGFTRGFHGVTLGSLALTTNPYFRAVAGVPLEHAVFLPYDDPADPDPAGSLEQAFAALDPGHLPAGVVVETIQGEGGVQVARPEWLRALRAITQRLGILLVVDDIQAGCGRSGSFLSSDESGVVPDVITLSKSLSGYGTPMSVVLIRPEFDVWRPAEHNGTFRGNNHGFVTGAATLDEYWRDDRLATSVTTQASHLGTRLRQLQTRHPEAIVDVRGRGFLQGVEFADPSVAAAVQRRAFDLRLVIERAGPDDEVVKFMPALTITRELLDEGLDLIDQAVDDTLG